MMKFFLNEGVSKKYIDTMVGLLNSNGKVNMTDVLDGSKEGESRCLFFELFTMINPRWMINNSRFDECYK